MDKPLLTFGVVSDIHAMLADDPGISREDRGPLRAEYDAPKTMPNQTSDFDVKGGLFATVFPDRVEIARIDFASGLALGAPWIVPVPARPRTFEERAAEAMAPQFPDAAALTVSETVAATRGLAWHAWDIAPESKPALRLDFPAATEVGRTVEYEIAVEGEAGGSFATRICAVGGLYPPSHPKAVEPECAVIALDRLPADAKTVSVVPLDSFGNRGRPLEARVPSWPEMIPSLSTESGAVRLDDSRLERIQCGNSLG